MTERERLWVMLAGLATLLVSLLDSTIVTTAAVPIVHSLNPGAGTGSVPWLLASYVLAGTVVQPLYGKLADAYGVKIVYLSAIAVFVVFSTLCGLARSMPELIVLRALQGLGGGGLMSLTMVLFGHLRAEDETGQADSNNATAAVLVGAGLVLGPLAGGLITEGLSWHWIFFFNVPLGLACLAVLARFLRLPVHRQSGSLEIPSALCLGLAGAALLTVCQTGGREFAWGDWRITAMIVAGLVGVGLFVWRQLVSEAPFFPPRLLREPTLRVLTVLQLTSGVALTAGVVYLTLELQLLRGSSPAATGLHLLPIAIGLGIGSRLGLSLVRRNRPLRTSIVLGSLASAAALAGLALYPADAPYAGLYVLMLLFGTGTGIGLGNETLLIFGVVERRDIGVAVTGIRFAETLGTALGAAVFATVFESLAGGSGVSHAIGVVFGIGAVTTVAAAAIATRIPAGATARPEVPFGVKAA